MEKRSFTIIKEYAILVVSAVIYAFTMHYFVFPNEFTNGGVTGITAMINYLIRTDKLSGVINLAFNVPLIIVSFVYLSREFAVKTTVHIILVSSFMELFAMTGVGRYQANGDVGRSILATLYGGCLAGISLALVLGIRGSSGGADVVGAIIQKKNPALEVQWGIFTVNSVIIGISAIVFSYDLEAKHFVFSSESFQPIMLALIFQFASAKVCDFVLQGAKTALKFEVVTDCPDELSAELISVFKARRHARARRGYVSAEGQEPAHLHSQAPPNTGFQKHFKEVSRHLRLCGIRQRNYRYVQ